MRFGGYIIHSKSNVSNIIKKCKNLAENYNVKFKRQNTEDYSWKIEGFQKAHFYFDIASGEQPFFSSGKILDEVSEHLKTIFFGAFFIL